MSKREGVMLAKKLSPSYLARLPEQVYFQPKINGQRCRVEYYSPAPQSIIGKPWLRSSQANLINSVPHINEQLEKLPGKHRFDGELWHPDLKFQEVSAIVRKTTRLDPRYKMLNYYIFDIIEEGEQWERFNTLYGSRRDIVEQENLKVLKWYSGHKDNWEWFYDKFIDEGYEGLIIRNPDAFYQTKKTADLLKKKKTFIKEFKILGAFQADAVMGVQVNMLGGLFLETESGEEFLCGAGCLSHEERRMLWQPGVSVGSTAVIEYPELTKRGVPHQPILKEIL